jgi:hypothetical protein
VELLAEEMRRVLVFLEWKATWWMNQGNRPFDVSPDIADGVRAYAAKQAHIHRTLADSFRQQWDTKRQGSGVQGDETLSNKGTAE